MVLMFPQPIFVVVNDSGRIRLPERPPLASWDGVWVCSDITTVRPKGIEHSAAPLDTCSRMFNPRPTSADLPPVARLQRTSPP